jgi:ssDNA-binding Zn-finger/Zn-ribbon topoisomerase 1
MGEPVRCPKCNEPAVIVQSNAGTSWWGCINPECKQLTWSTTPAPTRTIADEALRR